MNLSCFTDCWTGHVPFLEVDGKQLFESRAILRYLARKLDLEAPDPLENSLVDSVLENSQEFMVDIKPYFVASVGGNIKANAALYKELYFPHSETYFTQLTKMVTSSKSGFLVNCGVTWGDFFVVE